MEFIGPAIAFLVAFWVYSDAKGRGKTTTKALLWFAGVFFILICRFGLLQGLKLKLVFNAVKSARGKHRSFSAPDAILNYRVVTIFFNRV